MALRYRLHSDDDVPALQRLWEGSSEWGALPPGHWRRYVVEAPNGGASIVVAEDDASGEIAAAFAFLPMRVSVGGRVVSALRPAAPITNRAMRAALLSLNPLSHPISELYRFALGAFRDCGHSLLFMIPDPQWVRLLRLSPAFQCGSFPLWSLPLPLARALPVGDGYTAGALDRWDERVDRLWEASARLYDCIAVRDASTLAWKIGNGEYTVTAVERAGELIGLVAGRRKGDRQWLLCDLLSADAEESLQATLRAAVNVAHDCASRAAVGEEIRKIALLTTPLMERTVRELGFVREDYSFPFAVHLIDDSIEKRDLAVDRWYVSAND